MVSMNMLPQCVRQLALCVLLACASWHYTSQQYSGGQPVLVWWTAFTGDPGTLHDCGRQSDSDDASYRCYVTENRSMLASSDMAAVLFYGSHFSPWDVPLPRQPHHLWALLHEESPKNAPIFCHRAAIRLFNMTSTFRRRSDVPLTLLHLPSLRWLTSTRFVVPVERKFSAGDDRAALVYLASSCENPAERDEYVRHLARHINIDSYGACLNNRSLPSHLQHQLHSTTTNDSVVFDAARERSLRRELYHLLAGYKFYLAFENAGCTDYITEKLWRPLALGVVPVYLGAGNVRRWLPCRSAAVVAADFQSPEALAAHLRMLASNESAYAAHLCHKQSWPAGRVRNARLRRAMRLRSWTVQPDPALPDRQSSRAPGFIEEFQCAVCRAAWHLRLRQYELLPRWPLLADMRHYGCQRPRPYLSRRQGDSDSTDSWWTQQWHHAALQAQLLASMVNDNTSLPLTRAAFTARVLRMINYERDEL